VLGISAYGSTLARYIKQNYGVSWDNPELYQLILDIGKISEETATQIICQAVSSKLEE